MAAKLRSLVTSKVLRALRESGLATNTGDRTRDILLPLLRVNPKPPGGAAAGCVGYSLSLHDLHAALHANNNSNNISNDTNGEPLNTLKSRLFSLGSSVVSQLPCDVTLRSASLHAKDKSDDVTLAMSVHSPPLLSEVLRSTVESPSDFWVDSPLLATIPHQRVVVEFSSPNIAKPFHVGHLRSTVLGHSLARLHKALGHTVTSINFLGDWGTQFGLLKYGYDAKGLSRSDLSQDAIRKLYDVYVWANARAEEDDSVRVTAQETFAKMEAGDERELGTWKFFRDISLEDLRSTYSRLGITFDEYHGESRYSADKCSAVLEQMQHKGLLLHMPDGRKMFEFDTNRRVTVVKSDGSSIYLSRDIAAAVDRYDRYQFDRHYYVVDIAQADHFRALFSALRRLGYDWADRMRHVRFGRIEGLSSRKGNAAFLTDLLDDGRQHMTDKQNVSETTLVTGSAAEAAADIQALSAFVIADLRQRRTKNYNFSWDSAMQTGGVTGSKLQYTHCRLLQLQRNCGVQLNPRADAAPLLQHAAAIALVANIARFDEILYRYHDSLEPSVLVNYLTILCVSINRCVKELQVRGVASTDAEARLLLFVAARHTLAAAMTVLGLEPLEQM